MEDWIPSFSQDLPSNVDLCIGEPTHGSSTFQNYRSEITFELIRQRRIKFVAIEWDCSDCTHLNHYVKGYTTEDPYTILTNLSRWPRWLWGTQETLTFIRKLRAWNDLLAPEEKISFCGLDLFSFRQLISCIKHCFIEDLPEELRTEAAQSLSICMESLENNEQDPNEACQSAMKVMSVEKFEAIRRWITSRTPKTFRDYEKLSELGLIIDNILANREYYQGKRDWDIRDKHMFKTFLRLKEIYRGNGVFWGHNVHCGDNTFVKEVNYKTFGQFLRQALGNNRVFLIAMTNYSGETLISDNWYHPPYVRQYKIPKSGSWEESFGTEPFIEIFDGTESEVYRPMRVLGITLDYGDEEYLNYALSKAFNAVIHFNRVRPTSPL